MTTPLGIIAGTGFYDLDALRGPGDRDGRDRLRRGEIHARAVARHPRCLPDPPWSGPLGAAHLVNYRANIRALADAGVRDVVAVNVTGSIDPELEPGDLLCLDDFLDFTKGRVSTFHDGSGPEGSSTSTWSGPITPSCAARSSMRLPVGEAIRDGGVYACFEGPRFETPAEIRLARLAGADVAGMTGVPEVVPSPSRPACGMPRSASS